MSPKKVVVAGRVSSVVVDEDGESKPATVQLDEDASALWAEWYGEHVAEMMAESLPRRLRGLWAKLPAQLASLMLVLHAVDVSQVETSVRVETLEAAADLLEYFKSHARRAYRQLGQRRRDRVLALLEGLKKRGPMNQRAILHDVFKRNVSAEWVRSALEELEESGLVVRQVVQGETGRPATIWMAT